MHIRKKIIERICGMLIVFAVAIVLPGTKNIALAIAPQKGAAKKICSRHYKFTIALPPGFIEMEKSPDSPAGDELFYGYSRDLILSISGRNGKFKSVDDYLDCSKDQLERMLGNAYGDTTLRLVNCSRSPYYPKKITRLYFRVTPNTDEGEMNLIYFIHHRRKDIQIYFTFSHNNEAEALSKMNGIVKSLKLK